MSFQKIAPVVFLSVVMGSACIYASYPYIMSLSSLSEKVVEKAVEKSKKSVDRPKHPGYPVGTFEHEHKRTI